MPSRPKKHRDMGCEYYYSTLDPFYILFAVLFKAQPFQNAIEYKLVWLWNGGHYVPLLFTLYHDVPVQPAELGCYEGVVVSLH